MSEGAVSHVPISDGFGFGQAGPSFVEVSEEPAPLLPARSDASLVLSRLRRPDERALNERLEVASRHVLGEDDREDVSHLSTADFEEKASSRALSESPVAFERSAFPQLPVAVAAISAASRAALTASLAAKAAEVAEAEATAADLAAALAKIVVTDVDPTSNLSSRTSGAAKKPALEALKAKVEPSIGILDTDTSSTMPTSPSTEVAPMDIHAAVWLADCSGISRLLSARADVNEVDVHGVTPLLLAIQLLPRAAEYRQVVQYLLDVDADPRLRSSHSGWSPLDEAVSAGDRDLTSRLFDAAQRRLQVRWKARLASLAWSLGELPDFDCSLRWEFESPMVPLLSKFAPSDVVRVRKKGTSLRIDSTLASWKRFRFSKRRELTTLFRGNRLREDTSLAACMINHSKQCVVDMTEGLDSDEVQVLVDDLIAADIMQWNMKVDEFDVTKSTSWLGIPTGNALVNGWQTQRFDVRGTFGMSLRKKGHQEHTLTFQQYFNRPLPISACLPELKAEFSSLLSAPELIQDTADLSAWSETSEHFGREEEEDLDERSYSSELLETWPGALPQDESEPLRESLWKDPPKGQRQAVNAGTSTQTTTAEANKAPPPHKRPKVEVEEQHRNSRPVRMQRDQVGKSSKSVSASIWLSSNFPIPMQKFFPILEALSVEHEPIRRFQELLQSQELQQAAAATAVGNVFPVKASIPVNMAVRAVVHCETFSLVSPDALSDDLFELPQNYNFVPRREAQKTLNRARKRMLLANLAL